MRFFFVLVVVVRVVVWRRCRPSLFYGIGLDCWGWVVSSILSFHFHGDRCWPVVVIAVFEIMVLLDLFLSALLCLGKVLYCGIVWVSWHWSVAIRITLACRVDCQGRLRWRLRFHWEDYQGRLWFLWLLVFGKVFGLDLVVVGVFQWLVVGLIWRLILRFFVRLRIVWLGSWQAFSGFIEFWRLVGLVWHRCLQARSIFIAASDVRNCATPA